MLPKPTPRWAPGVLLAALLAACGTPLPAAAPTAAPAADLATLAPADAPQTTLPLPATQEASPEPTASPGAASVPSTPIPPARRATFTPALPAPATKRPEQPKPPKPPTGQWTPYQSQAGGFTASYPDGWSVAEQPGADGEASVTFAGPGGAAQIVVQTRPAEIEPGQPRDLPTNRRCKTVLVGEAAGTRCGDTVTLMRAPPGGSAPTVVTISATPGVDDDTFESFLQQFGLAP